MSLTIVITRDVQPRYHGFLGSLMLEVGVGIYINPSLNREVRQRLWTVVERWHKELTRGAIVMVWRDGKMPSDIGLSILGEASRKIANIDDLLLTWRSLK